MPALAYPPSPPPLMVPPQLEDHLKNPPMPLTLEECLGDSVPEEVLASNPLPFLTVV